VITAGKIEVPSIIDFTNYRKKLNYN